MIAFLSDIVDTILPCGSVLNIEHEVNKRKIRKFKKICFIETPKPNQALIFKINFP